MDPPPPHAVSDPFLRLPRELVTHICSLIDLRPRLLVVSLLSKRWRTCALESVRDLGKAKLTPGLLAKFPRLETVELRDSMSEADLPPSLCSLHVCEPVLTVDGREPRLVRLTQLTFRPIGLTFVRKTGTEWARRIAAMVAKYAPFLQALSLHGLPAEALEAAICHYYPRLTSLSLSRSNLQLRTDSTVAQFGRLVAAHAEQLTCLTLGPRNAEPHLLIPLLRHLPALRTLHLASSSECLRAILPLVPASCSVEWCQTKLGEELAADLCPWLTQVKLPGAHLHPELLLRCTRLCSLTVIRAQSQHFTGCLPPPSLTRLSFANSVTPPNEWFVPLCNLRILTLPYHVTLPPSLCTTALRELTCCWETYTAGRGLLALCDLIAACPQLRQLRDIGRLLLSEQALAELEALVSFAQARYVALVAVLAHTTEAQDKKRNALLCRLRESAKWAELNLRIDAPLREEL